MGSEVLRLLIVGAGKSAGFAIEYWAKKCATYSAELWVLDRDLEPLKSGFGHWPSVRYIQGDVTDETALRNLVEQCSWVLSLLPAFMHVSLAKVCLRAGVNMATASYESPEMRSLGPEVEAKGLLFLNEMGLDPGIDHISALERLDGLKAAGETVLSFESHCGGLVRTEDCQGNPWQYKFTWNPMNVIRAGQGADSIWLENGEVQVCKGTNVFESFRSIHVQGSGTLQAYPNRDSLAYVEAYGLTAAQTVLRGTLRREHFCQAWQQLVRWRWVSDAPIWPESLSSYREAFAYLSGFDSVEQWANGVDGISQQILDRIRFIGLDADRPLPSHIPAECLLALLEPLWKLEALDRDEVIMVHRIKTDKSSCQSNLVVHGESVARTAMAKTVGLTLAMAVELAISKPGLRPGLHRPMSQYWYEDLLPMLASEGIEFQHQRAGLSS